MISLPFFNTAGDDMLWPADFRPSYVSLLTATLSVSILSLALPIMTLQVYDRILPNPGTGTLGLLLAGVFTAIFLEMLLRLCRSYLLGWSGAAYEHRLSCAALNHIVGADLSHRAEFGIGEYLHRMTAIGKLKDFYNGYALTCVAEIVFAPIFLLLIIHIAGSLAFVPVAILMVFTLISLWQGRKLRETLRERDISDDRRYNFLIESLEGVHTLKALALENIFSRRYETLEEGSTQANFDVTQATSAAFDTSAIFSHIMVAAVIVIGALYAIDGQITTGALIATILLSGRIMQPVQRVLALWIRYQDYTLAREKVEEIFALPQHAVMPEGTISADRRDGMLAISNVSYRRHHEAPWIIENADLTLVRGDTILLSSENPQANKVLLDLMTGVYPATSGDIIIDEHNVLEYLPEQLTEHIGYLHTEGVIFRGTVRDNLTCFGQIAENKVREVASLLKIDRDIAELPSGFDTFLNGNNTDTISPGLKQRIAMVRTLAPKPRIILFNNADRGLDKEGYSLVYNLLASLQAKTALLLISDDYNIQSLAERCFTFSGSRLTETALPNPIKKIQGYQEVRL